MDHTPPGGIHGRGEGGEEGFFFQPISSCEMSISRYFGSLNPNLEEFFRSHPPGSVHGGGGGGGKRGILGD